MKTKWFYQRYVITAGKSAAFPEPKTVLRWAPCSAAYAAKVAELGVKVRCK